MEELVFVDRRKTNCAKWDALDQIFGKADLHAMWVADMDIKSPACVRKALQDYVSMGAFGYYSVPDSYYQAFIGWEERHHGFSPQKEWLRFAPGVIAAFNWGVQAFSNAGDAVIVLTPVYYPFLNAVEDNGRKLVTSDLVNENGSYSIDFDDFEKKILENAVKLFILCSPHNPVGRVWKREELSALFEICKKHDVMIISDEIHQDLTFGGHENVPSFTVGDYNDRMICLTAPSKTFNLAGCQNSFIIIPDEKIRARWDQYTKGLGMGGNSFGYVAAEAAYRDGDDWYDAMRAHIEANYQYVRDRIREDLPGVVISPLEGTYLLWLDLRYYADPAKTKDLLIKKCSLAPDLGEWFGGERFAGFARFNLATSRENVEKGMNLLTRIKD